MAHGNDPRSSLQCQLIDDEIEEPLAQRRTTRIGMRGDDEGLTVEGLPETPSKGRKEAVGVSVDDLGLAVQHVSDHRRSKDA